jgi:hypothetical protein
MIIKIKIYQIILEVINYLSKIQQLKKNRKEK